MNYALVIRAPARDEFDEAFDWYERQRAGLGVDFAEHVQAVFDLIAVMPEIHAVIYKGARKARVRPFPYSVIYRIRGAQVIVLAVFHDRRNPKAWQSRA